MSDLTSLAIAELRDGLRGGEFSAREIAESYNAAVEARNAQCLYRRDPRRCARRR